MDGRRFGSRHRKNRVIVQAAFGKGGRTNSSFHPHQFPSDTKVLMRFKRTLLSCALLLMPAAAIVLAQASVTGVWLLHAARPDGTSEDSFLKLEQQGSAVTGTLVRNYRQIPILKGSFTDGKLRVEAKAGRTRTVIFDGTLEGDRLLLTRTLTSAPGGNTPEPVKVTGERSSEDALQPPKPLPPPALHDVPENGLARTPPMGWNSWNHFAGRIDDATVRATADAIVSSGMKDAGYIYVNIDDTWEGTRDAQGNITTNKKFPNMKALADYVHSKGLKVGIYSSPGPKTCAGYEGSYGHEAQDAKTYAEWGIDYLKYDWCSAGEIYKDSDMQAVYQKMGDALQASGRPIVFSLCQYGRADVWLWGAKVGGNLWRTTGDIQDNWHSLETIGFKQSEINQYVRPGHWNDPDMLEVGNGGMTKDEYQVHMSLWALLSAPLLAGNDLQNMTDETRKLLMNPDIIAVDQDPSAHHVKRVTLEGNTEAWSRELQDGSTVVALFNRDEKAKPISVSWSKVGLSNPSKGKNLWTHQDVDLSGDSYTVTVAKHGVVLLRISNS
jgi:alpha-galactosidase